MAGKKAEKNMNINGGRAATEPVSRSALPGNERKLDYTVLPVPADRGRFGFTWDVLKARLGKIVFVNLLMLVSATPLIVIFILRLSWIAGLGSTGAFGDNLGVGYPATPSTVGLQESLTLSADALFFALAIAGSVVAALGIAGGLYCTRKLMRSDDKFRLIHDFGQGIKHGFLYALVACLLSFSMLFLCVYVWDLAAYEMVMGASKGLWIFLRVLLCVLTALVMLYSLWFLAVGSCYRLSIWGTVKNAARLCFGTFFQSVFFAAFAACPVVLVAFSNSVINFILEVYFILLGFSLAALIWGAFCDWAFDSYASYTVAQTDAQESVRREAIEKAVAEQDIYSLLLIDGRSEFLANAIEPVDKGTHIGTVPYEFSAADLKALAERRAAMGLERDAYAEKYRDDEFRKEYNARFAERDKALVAKDKKGRKKKFEPKMLNE